MWGKYVFFLVTALLNYNSHTIQFTHLNGTINWALENIPSCASITILVLEHFHHPGFAFNRGRRPLTGVSIRLATLPGAPLVSGGQMCVIMLAAVVGASGRASQESH